MVEAESTSSSPSFDTSDSLLYDDLNLEEDDDHFSEPEPSTSRFFVEMTTNLPSTSQIVLVGEEIATVSTEAVQGETGCLTGTRRNQANLNAAKTSASDWPVETLKKIKMRLQHYVDPSEIYARYAVILFRCEILHREPFTKDEDHLRRLSTASSYASRFLDQDGDVCEFIIKSGQRLKAFRDEIDEKFKYLTALSWMAPDHFLEEVLPEPINSNPITVTSAPQLQLSDVSSISLVRERFQEEVWASPEDLKFFIEEIDQNTIQTGNETSTSHEYVDQSTFSSPGQCIDPIATYSTYWSLEETASQPGSHPRQREEDMIYEGRADVDCSDSGCSSDPFFNAIEEKEDMEHLSYPKRAAQREKTEIPEEDHEQSVNEWPGTLLDPLPYFWYCATETVETAQNAYSEVLTESTEDDNIQPLSGRSNESLIRESRPGSADNSLPRVSGADEPQCSRQQNDQNYAATETDDDEVMIVEEIVRRSVNVQKRREYDYEETKITCAGKRMRLHHGKANPFASSVRPTKTLRSSPIHSEADSVVQETNSADTLSVKITPHVNNASVGLAGKTCCLDARYTEELASICLARATTSSKNPSVSSTKDPKKASPTVIEQSNRTTSGNRGTSDCGKSAHESDPIPTHSNESSQKGRVRERRPKLSTASYDKTKKRQNNRSTKLTYSSDDVQSLCIKCTGCGVRFKYAWLLKRHKDLDYCGKKNKACTVCGCDFTTKSEVRRHMLVHNACNRYVCDECDFRFRSLDHLAHHKRKIHEPEVVFVSQSTAK